MILEREQRYKNKSIQIKYLTINFISVFENYDNLIKKNKNYS